MRRLLDLFIRNPRGEFLDESWQFYMMVERVEKKLWGPGIWKETFFSFAFLLSRTRIKTCVVLYNIY